MEVGVRYLRVGSVVLALSLCLSVLVSSASAKVTRTSTGHPISLMVRGQATSSGSGSGNAPVHQVLVSHGGPVLSSETPYLVYWAPAGHPIATSSQHLMNTYLSDVAAASRARSTTDVYSVLGQYGAPYAQAFNARSQAVVDTDPYPTNLNGCHAAPGYSACVTDAALQSEISHLMDARRLPHPSAPGTGTTPIFFMITPVDVNVCINGNACVSSNNFCAYHDFFTHNSGDVLYASVPFSVFANGNTKGCQTDQYSIYETPVGSSGDEAYNIADNLSHELSETITDPLISAWYSNGGLEVADLCEAYGPTAETNKGLSPLSYAPAFGNASAGVLYDQVVNGDQYYNQTEYSNNAGACQTGISPLP